MGALVFCLGILLGILDIPFMPTLGIVDYALVFSVGICFGLVGSIVMGDIQKARLRCLVLAEGDVGRAELLVSYVMNGVSSVTDDIGHGKSDLSDVAGGLSTDGDTAKPGDPYFKPLRTKK